MKVLAIIDKFKGTMSSSQLGKIVKSTLNHNVDYFAISDGGDGFLESINKGFSKKYCYAHDAYNKYIKVSYLMDKEDVYIEVAKIIGVKSLIDKPNIFNASSYGVGEIILNAIKKGGKNFYIGLGGTITNDGGKGMLEALGFDFSGEVIKSSKINFNDYKFTIVSDVTNPLLKENGATYVFAKQKGAINEDLPLLEKRMEEFSNKINNYLKFNYCNMIGSGAAGGLGFAFLSLLNANYCSGINFIIQKNNLINIAKNYDLIITGEGKIDEQSLNGKVAFELLKLLNKPTIMVCGINMLKESCFDENLKGIYSIVPDITNIENSITNPKKYFRLLIKQIKI